MAQKHRLQLCQILCSNMEEVLQEVYTFTEKISHKSRQFKMHDGCVREVVTTKWEAFLCSYVPRCYMIDFAVRMMESSIH